MDISISTKPAIFITLSLMIGIIGCGKNDLKKKTLFVKTDSLGTEISKLSDIPLPLGYKVVASSKKDQTQIFECLGNMNTDQLTAFYKQRMEEQGWNIKSMMSTDEGLLLCSKPFRLCAIWLKPSPAHKKNQKNIASVHLFVHHGTIQEKTEHSSDSSIINGKSIA